MNEQQKEAFRTLISAAIVRRDQWAAAARGDDIHETISELYEASDIEARNMKSLIHNAIIDVEMALEEINRELAKQPTLL